MCAETLSLNNEVESLLAEARLPTSDLSNSRSLQLLGVRERGQLLGVVGIELYGEIGMLRSLAVAEVRRHTGLGMRLVTAAEMFATERGISTLYLLTTTAAGFFARLGYEVVPRSEAPTVIAATTQFAGLCPASSTFMRKVLSTDSSVRARR